jgi:hypothetical protein
VVGTIRGSIAVRIAHGLPAAADSHHYSRRVTRTSIDAVRGAIDIGVDVGAVAATNTRPRLGAVVWTTIYTVERAIAVGIELLLTAPADAWCYFQRITRAQVGDNLDASVCDRFRQAASIVAATFYIRAETRLVERAGVHGSACRGLSRKLVAARRLETASVACSATREIEQLVVVNTAACECA